MGPDSRLQGQPCWIDGLRLTPVLPKDGKLTVWNLMSAAESRIGLTSTPENVTNTAMTTGIKSAAKGALGE